MIIIALAIRSYYPIQGGNQKPWPHPQMFDDQLALTEYKYNTHSCHWVVICEPVVSSKDIVILL